MGAVRVLGRGDRGRGKPPPRCLPCADEAKRLREAVGLLHSDGALDLDATLRSRVVEGCLAQLTARIPIPGWAAPYDAETARLDALLRDIGDADWDAQVRLRWFEKERRTDRWTTVGGVISHLTAVDGLLSAALGLDDPLGGRAPLDPTERTEASWAAIGSPARAVREPWRAQSHELIRTASFAGRNVAETSVSYGSFALPLQDALVDRAFECWVHGWDIAEAVAYPYPAPSAAHLHLMIDLAARMLPAALAGRRRAGLAGPARDLVVPGEPGRSLHLEIEGARRRRLVHRPGLTGRPRHPGNGGGASGSGRRRVLPPRRGPHLTGGSGGGPGGRPRGHQRRAVRGGVAQL